MTALLWAGPVVTLVVCGAHLQGQPLNPALMALGAVFAGTGQTAPSYRMYALPPGAAAASGPAPAASGPAIASGAAPASGTLPAPADPGGGSVPARPGLVRQPESVTTGAAIEVELYRLPVAALGDLLVTIAPPLALGHVLMDDGSEPLGFVCEGYAAHGGVDITDFGNWRDYLDYFGTATAISSH